MAEADPFDDHPVRSKRNRKFPKVDRTKVPVGGSVAVVERRSIANPGSGPHEITVTPLDANGAPDPLTESLIVAMTEPVPDKPTPQGLVIEPPVDLSGMTVPELLLWVGDDDDRRGYALSAERGREKPRKGVLNALGG